MDIGGDCGIVLVLVMIVMAVARVAALIRISIFVCVFGGICSNCGFVGNSGLVLLVAAVAMVADVGWSIFMNCILIVGNFGIASGGGVINGCCGSSLAHYHNHH